MVNIFNWSWKKPKKEDPVYPTVVVNNERYIEKLLLRLEAENEDLKKELLHKDEYIHELEKVIKGTPKQLEIPEVKNMRIVSSPADARVALEAYTKQKAVEEGKAKRGKVN